MKAKRKPVGGVIGGINAEAQKRAVLARSHRGVIERRADDRFRFRLDAPLAVALEERLIVDGDWETVLAIVIAVHPHNLIDVRIPGGFFDARTHVVHVRRSPL